jgi:hypothetical protein
MGNALSMRACLGISGMKGNEGHWGGGISIISQNFPKSPSILFYPLESSISQTSPEGDHPPLVALREDGYRGQPHIGQGLQCLQIRPELLPQHRV